MGRRGGSPGAALARLLLLLRVPALCPAGPGPTIDGRALAARALREGESRAFTCRAPRPAAALAWYLDGRRQEPPGPAERAASTFTLTARRADRQLTCALTHPASGDAANASVHLDVQFAPEILRADARAEGPGLLVVLLALVQANPPAAVTWVGPDGRAVPNGSELLVPDAGGRPALANHTVRLRLGTAAGSFSVSAANGLGIANASVPIAGRSAGGPRGAAAPGGGCRQRPGPGRPAGPGLALRLRGLPPRQAGARAPRTRAPASKVLRLPAARGHAAAPREPVPAAQPAPQRPGAGARSQPRRGGSRCRGGAECPSGAGERPGAQQPRVCPVPGNWLHLQSVQHEQR
ncbi:transmembrane protein 25 isoform X3 [Dromaius novaehollandiae]|uniref:transmembrane protein 25 isoform X3 n=1 Tax=Dromaius novaehollandiae TaxID=8790 RepID=UPI00311E1EA8